MEFKKLQIDSIIPAEYNPRKKLKSGDSEFEKIKNSIKEFGYVDPIIVNKDLTVIGGHQRISVLKTLGFTEIDCVIIDIDKTKEKALNVALNKISGEWNKELLADLIKDLHDKEIKEDEFEKFYEFLLKSFKNMFEAMADGASIYVFHADKETVNFRTAFKDAGFFCHETCVWIKNPLHPTSKPLNLIAYPIKNSSLTNCIVLDPFGGSGATLIACEQTNRICHIIELDEKYTDVIVKRYIEVAGEKGVFLIRDGIKTEYSKVNITP